MLHQTPAIFSSHSDVQLPHPVFMLRTERTAYGVCVHQPDEPGRAEVEAFILARFYDQYGARPQINMPLLVSMLDSSGRLTAAVGLRPAARSCLFLEHYSDVPIDRQIARLSGLHAARKDIMEIGHLAACRTGVSRLLFIAVTRLLTEWQCGWIAFTGTAQVQNTFRRLRLPMLELGLADPQRLPDGTGDWGSYYDYAPKVIAANVAAGRTVLAQAGLLQLLESETTEEISHDFST